MTTPVNVSVRGGAGGITANLDDLTAMMAALRSAAETVDDVLTALTSPALARHLAIGARLDPVATIAIEAELAVLVSGNGSLRSVEADLQDLRDRLAGAALSYQRAEDGVSSSILDSVFGVMGGIARIGLGDFSAGRHELFDALPGLTDLLMTATGASLLEREYAEHVSDGHPVLSDLGTDTSPVANTPPRDITDLIDELALRNGGVAGEVSVSIVRGPDGRRSAIVDIPGTKSWSPLPGADVTGVSTDIRALAGLDTAYEDGVFDALQAAGVDSTTDIMLVGHSEGGIIAVNAARDASSSGRFRITHVVTAGSPIGVVARQLPASVQVLALENEADVVPHADGADNPDRPDLTTVTVDEQHDSVGADHDLDQSYLPMAAAIEHSCDASIGAFTQSARHFLDGSVLTTHAWVISRAP